MLREEMSATAGIFREGLVWGTKKVKKPNNRINSQTQVVARYKYSHRLSMYLRPSAVQGRLGKWSNGSNEDTDEVD